MGKRLEAHAVMKAVMELKDKHKGFEFIESNRRKILFNAVQQHGNWEADCLDGETPWDHFKEIVPAQPDGMLLNREMQQVIFIEVEDTNPLSERRLDRYAEASFHLDLEYWGVSLVVTDRYGANIRELDLFHWQFYTPR